MDLELTFVWSSCAMIQCPCLQLQTILWPGFVTEVPRGWVVPKNGRPLVIGVPNKIGYKEFVSSTLDSENRTSFHGFCIDVFLQALANLPYPLAYSFSKYGNGSSTPSYDALINMIVDKVHMFSTLCSTHNIISWPIINFIKLALYYSKIETKSIQMPKSYNK